MYAVSDEFLAALTQSGTPIFKADVLVNDVVIAENLPITGGSVDVDSSAAVRRRCTLQVVDVTEALVPTSAGDTLSPYGNELRVYRGYRINGTDEFVPLGTFRINEVKVVDKGFRTVAVSGFDRARTIQRYRFTAPYTIAAGTNYVTAIRDLISSRLPGVTFDQRMTTTGSTPLLVFEQMADPWDAVQKMATSIGAEVFFDPDGVCVIRDEPNPELDPVTFIYEDGVNANIAEVANTMSDEPGYNGAIVDGEPAGQAPVRAEAWDTDPASPTYYLGPYGKVPIFVKSIFITTQAQADAAAAAELRRKRGGTEQLSFTAVPNPAHEGGDTIRARRSALGLVDDNDGNLYLMVAFSIPLDVTSLMSPTTRKKRTL